jgi:methylamine dehydrogenase light chain
LSTDNRKWLDRRVEAGARRIARLTSRRNFLTRLGALIFGSASIPLLPLSRVSAQSADAGYNEPDIAGDAGDPTSCEYWRYCSIDGFMSSCCGGTATSCPPGTEMSSVTWIGTCRNPADGRQYLISYNDCCGKAACGQCLCNNNEADKPAYVTAQSNDINWCLANSSTAYNSTVALVLGVAE